MKNNISKLRGKLKMTQEQLASKVEVTRQTIIALEQNRYNPSLELGFRISRALGVERIEDVFEFE